MRSRQISSHNYVNTNEINKQQNILATKSVQISARGSLIVKSCLKKLNSSVFAPDLMKQFQADITNKNNHDDVQQTLKIQKQQIHQDEKNNNSVVNQNVQMNNTLNQENHIELHQNNYHIPINNKIQHINLKKNSFIQNINSKQNDTTLNLTQKCTQQQNQNNNPIISSRQSVLQMITRFKSPSIEERQKSIEPLSHRNVSMSPSMNKKINSLRLSSSNQNTSSSQTVTFLTLTQELVNENSNFKKRLTRSKTVHELNESKSNNRWSVVRSSYKQLFGEKKKDQCSLIKNAFTLLPNKRYLSIDDEKPLTIRTPISSCTSSSNSILSDELDIKQSNNIKKPIKLNESSKSFLKTFLKDRKQEVKMEISNQKSDKVRQIQQTILNKVINEMNKEKERQQIIKNFQQVKFLQKTKKKQTKEDFDPLIHFRSVDNFCKNKNVIVKINKGFHPPKDTSAIARGQQEEFKNFIIPCQKQNFFGSEGRRMLNRGVPQIIQSLQQIRN